MEARPAGVTPSPPVPQRVRNTPQQPPAPPLQGRTQQTSQQVFGEHQGVTSQNSPFPANRRPSSDLSRLCHLFQATHSCNQQNGPWPQMPASAPVPRPMMPPSNSYSTMPPQARVLVPQQSQVNWNTNQQQFGNGQWPQMPKKRSQQSFQRSNNSSSLCVWRRQKLCKHY